MARFTKALREQIVRDFTSRHNGRFDPAVFVDEVQAAGSSHPAHEWFEWDDDRAATSFRIDQARDFVQGIRISFTVENVERGRVVVREVVAPMVISPMAQRQEGGGYTVVDPARPDHMRELCDQGARDLDSWLRRYEGALVFAGGKKTDVDRIVRMLSDTAVMSGSAKAA